MNFLAATRMDDGRAVQRLRFTFCAGNIKEGNVTISAGNSHC